jgi:hypothetical protein
VLTAKIVAPVRLDLELNLLVLKVLVNDCDGFRVGQSGEGGLDDVH